MKTFILIKPDVANNYNNLCASIDVLLNSGDLTHIMRVDRLTRGFVDAMYAEHVGKSYYEAHAEFMMSGSVIMLVLEGDEIVSKVRGLLGPTDPKATENVGLRQKYGTELPCNGFHASDSEASAEREWECWREFVELSRPEYKPLFQTDESETR